MQLKILKGTKTSHEICHLMHIKSIYSKHVDLRINRAFLILI
jgi:hypothetical protein